MALTDAVVAIAMTLLVLPLVELSGEVGVNSLGWFFREHGDRLLSFVVSFLVIYVFWAAHSEAFRRLVAAHRDVPVLRTLNMCWLLVIAFLPFPTAVVGRELNTTTAPFYIGTMFVLSVLTSTIVVLVDGEVGTARSSGWVWLTTVIFAGCALLSLFRPSWGLFALLLLAIVRILETRLRSSHLDPRVADPNRSPGAPPRMPPKAGAP